MQSGLEGRYMCHCMCVCEGKKERYQNRRSSFIFTVIIWSFDISFCIYEKMLKIAREGKREGKREGGMKKGTLWEEGESVKGCERGEEKGRAEKRGRGRKQGRKGEAGRERRSEVGRKGGRERDEGREKGREGRGNRETSIEW